MLLNPNRHWWLIPASIITAFLWQFWPLSQTVRHIEPDAIVMVAMYWALRRPQQVSSGWAFALGLLRDSAEGSPLGMNALAMVIVIYIVQLMNERMRMFAIWQQSVVVGSLYVLYLLVCNWVLLLDPRSNNPSPDFICALSTGICWPVCYLLLQQLEQGFQRGPVRS